MAYQHVARRLTKAVAAKRAEIAAAEPSAASPASLPRFSVGNLPVYPLGLPDPLRSGIEALSGVLMDGVQVHYNSPHPARIGALAYARGREIHLGRGQEEHLPHEAWHLVQQAQGRVKPTVRMNGAPVNDDQGLEREADRMGPRALSAAPFPRPTLATATAIAPMPSGPAPIQRNGHPLADDESVLNVKAMQELKKLDPHATLQNLLLEDTSHARNVMGAYRRSRQTGEADAMLLKSILATAHLHKTGAMTRAQAGQGFSEEEKPIFNAAYEPYNRRDELVKAYGLTREEHRAFQAYSEANKGKKQLVTGKGDTEKVQENEYYMGRSQKLWGKFGDGWTALGSAMKKVPNLGALGVEMTTYRAPRTKTESDVMTNMLPGTNVLHGHQTMDQGQRHYMSTAITYNSHWLRGATQNREDNVGGMIGVTGSSGVFMNPFGLRSWEDGGEVLYPPGVMTSYEGSNPEGYKGNPDKGETTQPVFHLQEIPQADQSRRIVEDKDFSTLRNPHPIVELEELVHKHPHSNVINSARNSTGIMGDMADLTPQEVNRLLIAARAKAQRHPLFDLEF
jgi:Domain of unknown function (DUF4157)